MAAKLHLVSRSAVARRIAYLAAEPNCYSRAMPLVEARRYIAAPLHIGGHLQTILPSAMRRVRGVSYRRERLELADGDFVDMDWASALGSSSRPRAQRVVVLSHGLEGDSYRHYILALAKLFTRNGWDALAWNCRSCSGEMNRLPRLYHHGATEDLAAVVQFAIRQRKYSQVALVGVSLGGNLTLKYLGENGALLPPEVIGGVGISVPADLVAGEEILALPDRRIYQQRFLKKLRPKVEVMAQRVPGLSLTGYDQIKRFREFDDRYTAPLHGFASALDYYTSVSANRFVERITRPALLLSARNDPFLAPTCFPEAVALRHRSFYVEVSEQGGHVGFMQLAKEFSYSELRAFEFITSIQPTSRGE